MGGLRIEQFRQISGDRLTLDAAGTGVQKSELSLGDRFQAWRSGGSFSEGTVAHQFENRDFKREFYAALLKSEGPQVAQAAFRAAGLGPNWRYDSEPLGSREVKQVLDAAQHFRQSAIRQSSQNFNAFMTGAGQPSFQSSFQQLAVPNGCPLADLGDKQLQALVRREVKQHPDYGKRVLTPPQIEQAANTAINKFYALKQTQFREAHPGLAQFAQLGHAGMPREDNRGFSFGLMAKLNPAMGVGDALSLALAKVPRSFRTLARDALTGINATGPLLSKMAYEPAGWKQLANELDSQWNVLDQSEIKLTTLNSLNQKEFEDLFEETPGPDLRNALIADLRHQKKMIEAKKAFLDDVRTNDPLSAKGVAYSNLLWAEAADSICYEASQNLQLTDQANALLRNAGSRAVAQANQNYQDTSAENDRVETPTDDNKKTHPAVQGKAEMVAQLKRDLASAGVSESDIKELTSEANLAKARRNALNGNLDWAPIERKMVVSKDGVTRTYTSLITPGADISRRFANRYAAGQIRGVSSTTKDSTDHARNLKVSELLRDQPGGQPVVMAKVVGNGVLDMWDVSDPTSRAAANEAGANEVLEAAIQTNDRILRTALARNDNIDPTPVKVTHVSVNLTTPSPLREFFPGAATFDFSRDFQEMAYTQEQFRAFEANSGANKSFQIDDVRSPQADTKAINVDVETINFSFGINPLATDMPDVKFVQNVAGGWGKVYEKNREEMLKFVGDIGDHDPDLAWDGIGTFGSVGARPGGFIGSVYDRLESANPVPGRDELMGRIRDQTNTVRGLFTREDFRRGNGDPAKMSREILLLQGLAEEALALLNIPDQAATMSKGCKSDKDRGGVVDVELKHDLIVRDMGGEIVPDQRLEGDDQQIYYNVAMASGQLENQRLNTGLPGSKETNKLKERIPDLQVREYLAGLAAYASE